jgi:dynein heavy chain
LPQESFAIENAIIMENSSRWPLMIDPQMQGYNWIRGKYKTELDIIKPTMDIGDIQKKLKMSVQIGKPMLLADSIETFDALIEPILAKAVTKRGNNLQIKIGEDDIEYSEDFTFFITTKLSKPHFAPEVCVLVNILNMMVTETGLLDQMLT